MIPTERVVVTCQCDIKEGYLQEVEYLFKSLIKFGGNLSNAQKIVSFTSEPNNHTKKLLEDLNVSIRVVEPIDSRDIFATKIRNLEIDQMENFDYLVSLDVDILIRGDFSSYIDDRHIKAKTADMTPLTLEQWKLIFNNFGLEMPKMRYKTHFDLEKTIPYFNTGVLIIPRKYLSILHDSWKKFVTALLDSYSSLPKDISKHSHFNNQFAFSLALIHSKLPYHDLPLEMNFPTHHPIHSFFQPEKIKPYLIHYHHRFSEEGKFLHCQYNNINNFFDEINKSLI